MTSLTFLAPRMRRALPAALALLLGACAGHPPAPDWQMNAKGSMERFVVAYFEGDMRVEGAEFAKARAETARTGRVELVARVELLRCASRVASLVVEPCAGFETLRQDAPAAERAYADYLAAQLRPQDIGLLPEAQRGAASAAANAATLQAIADPLSRLVAAGVLFQAGRASPAMIAVAADTASAQGWQRPLLAWLMVQARLAEQAGDTAEAARLHRRIDLVQGRPG
ncbi:hypothetical protein [Variovorax terrae]|uniref:Lipoprotein n=1 Tax=Variovorax terrae TaxID=2923278 RepID=A0A9X1VZH7_9BURK|nr:hypothetical protein [Variovorax terrae]MCJ0764927.1 hypothetical protein [Variovorax terrae]